MSTYYSMWTEVLGGGEWHCADPYRLVDGKPILMDTYWSGSRSYFGEAADKLISVGSKIKRAELSPELAEYADTRWSEDGDEWLYTADIRDVRGLIPPGFGHEYHGLVHKDAIFSFESGEAEYIEPIEPEQYEKLSPKTQKLYEYYEWDDPMGWFQGIKTLLNHVDKRLFDYDPWGEMAARIIMRVS